MKSTNERIRLMHQRKWETCESDRSKFSKPANLHWRIFFKVINRRVLVWVKSSKRFPWLQEPFDNLAAIFLFERCAFAFFRFNFRLSEPKFPQKISSFSYFQPFHTPFYSSGHTNKTFVSNFRPFVLKGSFRMSSRSHSFLSKLLEN